ncbi:MAG: cytochrome c oxidase accessory protein CcoG [Deltaproteobacteria bacterium]|nr:cytochrome c oxidase accessory protein CcoG [Deltaproteobacteria bacterium]
MSGVTEKSVKIYAKSVTGRFSTIRWSISAFLLGVFFALPWIRFEGRQAVLFDIPERKFYIFNLIIWPQEGYYLAILLVFLAISLFVFTAVAGRLWCGYVCPQTVFTDIFGAIERLIEGDRRQRMELDGSALSARKVIEKAAKHSAWIVFSFATAFAFVAYFVPARLLLQRLATMTLTHSNVFWLAFFTVTTYVDCAFIKELMCVVPCPYGRFQSTLFDQDTLIIGYDGKRGEPRGHIKKTDGRKTAGDCIDCTLCVQVCPTGIDIRNGLQYECIACAQCIDACNSVMRKVGRPEGLIRYGSLRSLGGARASVLRPRVVVYAAILTALFSTFAYKLATRIPLDVEVLRDRASLYQKTADGRITNLYVIKAMNMDRKDHRYVIKTKGIDADIITGANPISVRSGEVYQASLALITRDGRLEGSVNRFDFILEDMDNPRSVARRQSTFLVPEDRVRVSRKDGRN